MKAQAQLHIQNPQSKVIDENFISAIKVLRMEGKRPSIKGRKCIE
jgi:hypothetical protein